MNTAAFTIEEVENEIASVYQWFHKEAPGVTPLEEGNLGALWALFDLLIEEGQ